MRLTQRDRYPHPKETAMHERATSLITYTASGTAIIGGLALSDWGVIIGSAVAVIGLLYGMWHKRELRRIARRHRHRRSDDPVEVVEAAE